jgi:hypothetical protein
MIDSSCLDFTSVRGVCFRHRLNGQPTFNRALTVSTTGSGMEPCIKYLKSKVEEVESEAVAEP